MANPDTQSAIATSRYRGRFAPSPTGPLHFGSLIAATGSYLQARTQHGEWWVRIDDIDPPREVAGASDDILRTLECSGFEWDGAVQYQHTRHSRYAAAIAELQATGLAYPCSCSRKSLLDAGYQHHYPGLCRRGPLSTSAPHSIRVLTEQAQVNYLDGLQGQQDWDLAQHGGDFIIQRADGLFSYQLATGVDDAEQGMTEVVRGSDLLDSTPRQIYLQQLLGLPSPAYLHLPVVLNADGQKLSKQTFAQPVKCRDGSQLIWNCLKFLGQAPPNELQHVSLGEIWEWALHHWQVGHIPSHNAVFTRN